MHTPATEQAALWDLTNCEREPIHTPGAIQAHGYLVAFQTSTAQVDIVSENTVELFGIQTAELLKRSVFDILDFPKDTVSLLQDPASMVSARSPLSAVVAGDQSKIPLQVFAYRSDELTVLEIQNAGDADDAFSGFYHESREAISALRSSVTLAELYQAAVAEVRKLTQFDRTIIYKFDEDYNGHVLAETKSEKGDSYLDLHFPASDIPKQARELYRRTRIRVIPNTDYRPTKLVSNPNRKFPLDMSLSALRAVSPIHIEYLKNMPATASMSISILVGDRLWGLISCTHMSGPLPISFEKRAVCELIGEIVSSLIPPREEAQARLTENLSYQDHSKLLAAMSEDDDFVVGLLRESTSLLKLTGAQGAAVVTDGNWHVVGLAPETQQLQQVLAWLESQSSAEVICTNQLPALMSQADEFKDLGCGVLAFPVSSTKSSYVIWFRPEVLQTVRWGGDPRKPVEMSSLGHQVLHPRKSFEAWKETVSNRSLPWHREDIEAAKRLRRAIVDVVLRKLERISSLNRELERSNTELDSFAYAASHDLKEPLRGITNYSTLLARKLEPRLTDEDRAKFTTIARLTQRMEALINSLLDYSQVGRAELAIRPNDLNEIIRSALDSLKTRIDENQAKIRCDFDFPTVTCDRVQFLEVYTNLISNALKYNDKAAKEVWVGWTKENNTFTFFVRDNGIGIAAENLKSIFKIFKRLHAKDQFGGGTGTGLTITEKIIERHDGQMWVQSEPGLGTTFFFTIGARA